MRRFRAAALEINYVRPRKAVSGCDTVIIECDGAEEIVESGTLHFSATEARACITMQLSLITLLSFNKVGK